MRSLIKYITISLILSSCAKYSEEKIETGVVVAKSFSPEFDGSGVGIGATSNGNSVITTTNIHKEEQFVIAFQCKHGVIFTIDEPSIFAKLNVNDSVTIVFEEKLSGIGDKYKFIDANKIK